MGATINLAKIPALFRDILNREVTTTKIPPFNLAPTDASVLAVYEDDNSTLVGTCVCDNELVASAGAALVLIPYSVAKEALATRKIDPSLAENFQEVLNIAASLFTSADNHRTKLTKVYDKAADRPQNIVDFMKASKQQYPFKLTIAGYGGGRLCIYM